MAQPTDQNLYDQVQRLKQRVDELERQKADTDRVLGEPFIKSLEERLTIDKIGRNQDTSVSGLNQSVNESGSSSYSVADKYDARAIIEVNGTEYYIGLYNT